MPTKEALRLNLGSRDRSVPGFRNMDIEAHEGVDYVGDVADLSRFKDGEVDELFASNILEHFPHTRTVEILNEWRRVLCDGGQLLLSVPNFRRVVQIYLKTGMEDWIQNFLMGDQGYKTAFHYAIFDEAKLATLVTQAGFKSFDFVKFLPGAMPKDCSRLISNQDFMPVCINMVARK